jgi:hypothetical protein
VSSLRIFRGFLDRMRILPEPYVCAGSLHIDYVANADFNAVALTREAHEFIGVFGGIPVRLLDAFFTLLSSNIVLPQIGNIHVERMPPETLQVRLANLFNGGVNSSEQLPKDSVRRRMAAALSVNALTFLFAHEFAHIARGHLSYLNTELPLQTYTEWSRSSDLHSRNDIIQALEFGADFHAAIAAWHLWSLSIGYAGKLGSILRRHPGLWAFSLGVMFRMLEQFRSIVLTHPLPSTRFASTTLLAAGLTSHLAPESREVVLHSVTTMAKQSVDLWEHLGLGTETFMRHKTQIERDIKRHLKDYSAIETSILLSLQNVRSDSIRERSGYRYTTSHVPTGEEWEARLADDIRTAWKVLS